MRLCNTCYKHVMHLLREIWVHAGQQECGWLERGLEAREPAHSRICQLHVPAGATFHFLLHTRSLSARALLRCMCHSQLVITNCLTAHRLAQNAECLSYLAKKLMLYFASQADLYQHPAAKVKRIVDSDALVDACAHCMSWSAGADARADGKVSCPILPMVTPKSYRTKFHPLCCLCGEPEAGCLIAYPSQQHYTWCEMMTLDGYHAPEIVFCTIW